VVGRRKKEAGIIEDRDYAVTKETAVFAKSKIGVRNRTVEEFAVIYVRSVIMCQVAKYIRCCIFKKIRICMKQYKTKPKIVLK